MGGVGRGRTNHNRRKRVFRLHVQISISEELCIFALILEIMGIVGQDRRVWVMT